ncbi:cupin domain-containing protein, partial [Pseudomonadota bacterium]
VDVGEGIVRQNLGFDDSLLLARVSFENGSIGYTHAHPHSQVAYVESGVFDFSIGSETRRMEAGDCVYIPPNAQHGAVCVEAGVLLDIFSPCREDLLPENIKE